MASSVSMNMPISDGDNHSNNNSIDEGGDTMDEVEEMPPPPPQPGSPQVTSTSTKDTRKRSAKIWNDYDIYFDATAKKEKARCKACKKIYAIGSSTHGTTNLIKHKDRCVNRTYEDVGQMHINHEASLRSKRMNQLMYREKMAIAITKHNYPFSMVEHDGLRDVHIYLNPNVKVYTRNTSKNDCLKLYEREMQRVKADLAKVSGRICLTSDVWSSLTSEGYICLTAHYVDEDWVLCSRILNFCPFPPPHNGVFMCDRVLQFLKEWGIEKKIFSITLDNASSCDNMHDHLKCKLKNDLLCDGVFFHIRCSAHILNLIVQDGLKVANDALVKIRESVKYVKGSQARLIKFSECCKEEGVTCQMGLRLDVCIRWNSTFTMLRSALQYRSVFALFAVHDPGYRKCPSEQEWEMIHKIHDLLKPFYVITTLFSGSDYPTANQYFENVWTIQKLLIEHKESEDHVIRKMASDMILKFEKYWDHYSVVLALSFALDPRNKLDLVKFCYKKINDGTSEAKFEKVENALDLLFQEYVRLYSKVDSHPNSTMEVRVGGESSLTLFQDETSELENYKDINVCTRSELQIFLEEAKISRATNRNLDVLKWWKSNSSRYPILSLMARDLMTIPITTVASESAFSIGAKVLTKYRSSLRPESAQAVLCTRNWLCGYEVEDDFDDDQLDVPIILPSEQSTSSTNLNT